MIYEIEGTVTQQATCRRRVMAETVAEARAMATALGITPTAVTEVKDEAAAAVLLQEASDWARHYSSVRMTVTTFFITLSTGMLGFKWGTHLFVILAMVVWLVAIGLFITFTIPEIRELRHRRPHLSTLTGKPQETGIIWDWGSFAMLILTLGFLFGCYASWHNWTW